MIIIQRASSLSAPFSNRRNSPSQDPSPTWHSCSLSSSPPLPSAAPVQQVSLQSCIQWRIRACCCPPRPVACWRLPRPPCPCYGCSHQTYPSLPAGTVHEVQPDSTNILSRSSRGAPLQWPLLARWPAAPACGEPTCPLASPHEPEVPGLSSVRFAEQGTLQRWAWNIFGFALACQVKGRRAEREEGRQQGTALLQPARPPLTVL